MSSNIWKHVYRIKYQMPLVHFEFHARYIYSCEAVSWAKLYCGDLGFLQFKEFELYWGAVFFFLRSVTHFHDFWSQIGVVILVTPKQEVERKSEWFCGVNFFRSNFKVEWENGVWTKIRFLGSDFLFTCGNFTLIFTVFFSIFWIGFFF